MFVCLAACILFSYVLPSVIERSLVGRIGPFWAYVVLGDALGCVAIGLLTRWTLGVAVYVLLSAIEALLYRFRVVDAGWMMWTADLVPTLLLCLLVSVMLKLRWRFGSSDKVSRRD